MAGTVTIKEVTYTSPKKITFTWAGTTADATTTNHYNGVLILVTTVPGTGDDQPDDNYSLELNNGDGIDMLAGQGASRDEANTEFISSGMGAFAAEKITLAITNAGANNTGIVYVLLR